MHVQDANRLGKICVQARQTKFMGTRQSPEHFLKFLEAEAGRLACSLMQLAGHAVAEGSVKWPPQRSLR